MAYFNENDEMVITKVDVRKTNGAVPDGFVRVNLDEPIGNFKVTKEMTGERFIENLENVNKERALKAQQNIDDKNAHVQQESVGLQRKVSQLEVDAVKGDNQDDSTMIDLNPKKHNSKTDNIFMDFMALYSRASHNDKN